MTARFTLFIVALAGLLSVAGTRAQPPAELPVAPPPREVRPDGSRVEVPQPKAGMDPKKDKEPGPMPGGGMKEPMPKDKTDPNANPMNPAGGTPPNNPLRVGPPFLTGDDGKDKGTAGSRDKDRKQVDQFRS